MPETNIDKKMKELIELVKPIQNWLLENYDSMCKVEINDSHIRVYRNEMHILNDIYDEREIEKEGK